MNGLNFLEMKNRFWFKTAQMLDDNGLLEKSLVYLETENSYPEFIADNYLDLLAISFVDECGYVRNLFIPIPIVLSSKSAISKKIKKLIEKRKVKIISRAWHDEYFKNNVLLTDVEYEPEGEDKGDDEELPSHAFKWEKVWKMIEEMKKRNDITQREYEKAVELLESSGKWTFYTEDKAVDLALEEAREEVKKEEEEEKFWDNVWEELKKKNLSWREYELIKDILLSRDGWEEYTPVEVVQIAVEEARDKISREEE